MKANILFFIVLAASFLPFILFAFLNSKANVKKEKRNRQYAMPAFAVVYSAVLLIFLNQISTFITDKFMQLAGLFDRLSLTYVGDIIRDLHASWEIYLSLVLFNTAALLLYILIKRVLTLIMGGIEVRRDTFIGSVVELFYSYDEMDDSWYIKNHFGQARTFIMTVYYGSCAASALALLVSCWLCMNHLVSAPFYPVFAIIIIGEMAFFIDGLNAEEGESNLSVQTDASRHIAMYPLLRKPLRALFGDKLSAEGTTVNNGSMSGGAVEDVLVGLEQTGGHIGINYASFIRRKMDVGLKPNEDYVRSGYDLAVGKSLLFNTPFYDKLNPYVFYAMNRELLTGGKVLIVLGRHGTEEDLCQWSEEGMKAISNIPELWKIAVLTGKKVHEDNLPDIGIISRSGVHDLDIHKNNLPFLKKVSFVFVVEPSRLVTTAQIGLNLLIKCCGKERAITFCSVDRNCDGLVDALSHILMTNITEVSATEYPPGMSSYMYWTADDDYLQHRVLPGISRCLGMGTELAAVALRNQVKKTIWYGGEAFPVLDSHWIAKQYYYDLLDYAKLPTNQETFDQTFQASYNMCNERVSDYSFITVEDDRNNLFETRRNFATIAQQQGFVNVVSSEYMLREYMAANTEVFTADAKAIPYVTADYARTKRNAILSICLLLCIDSIQEEILVRQMGVLNVDTKDPVGEIWKEICVIFGKATETDRNGVPILTVKNRDGKTVCFKKDDTILFKRTYNIESGKFESVYTIEDAAFSRLILDDLQNASYIAEQENKDLYLGTELKGHVYQKYLPGQFFTLNGKYYEMVSTATDDRILVRRASEHIGGRLVYRQIRNYTIHHLEDSSSMGALKTVNNIDIHYQYADFSVETPGYWKMRANNDFDNGHLVKLNGVPTREYHHKQILKFDFSKLGDAFTDSVRMTLTNLLNESFVTLFADNQPYISAVTVGQYDAPLTYSLSMENGMESADKCIFILEDSQLDIGLLIAAERNINRIFQIIADYLAWNDEEIEKSIRLQKLADQGEKTPVQEDQDESECEKKSGCFGRVLDWFKNLFKKKNTDGEVASDESGDGLTPAQRKKAEKEAKKAQKKAEREQRKAEKQAAKEAAKTEVAETAEETPAMDIKTAESSEADVQTTPSVDEADEADVAVADEMVDETTEETTEEAIIDETTQEIASEEISQEMQTAQEINDESASDETQSDAQEPTKEQGEGGVSDNA